MREGGPVSDRPFVTVAIPCLNERGFIEACIRGVLDQDYPADRLEILVADGGSGDGTRSILARLAAEHPRLRVIDNPDRIQAAGLNASVKVARGEVIVRMDAHCEYQRDYLSRCVEALEATGADNVGGAQRAQARTFFQRALCAALRSPLGVGGARYRSAENEGFVDTVFLGAFRRRVFETVGLYDSRAVTNEDAELNQRLLAAGGRIYLSRDIVVHYYPRATLPALARQYFNYGRGRARSFLKHRTLPSLRPALPFFMLAAAAALLAIPSLRPLIPLSFALYALATGTEALRVGRRLGAATAALVWAIFPVLHVCHGLGFAAGLLRYAAGPDWAPPERLSRPDLTCS
ncbi:MAG: glycosyltransferase family 2 protein [Acidobacteria bacterium]|nr:MAG: glycosyltransferase family 2 protein [Acidobacteriota bacterium]